MESEQSSRSESPDYLRALKKLLQKLKDSGISKARIVEIIDTGAKVSIFIILVVIMYRLN